MAIEVFGWTLSKKAEKEEQKDQSNLRMIEPPHDRDGALEVDISNVNESLHQVNALQLDHAYQGENELIRKYREMSNHPEVDWAISEIVNESIVDVQEGDAVELNLDDVELPDKTKEAIHEEFSNIMHLLKFEEGGEEYFRDWYVDARIAFHKVIDNKNPKKGIQKLVQLDPLRLKKIREVERDRSTETGAETVKGIQEYYVYSDGASAESNQRSGATNQSARNAFRRNFNRQMLKMRKDSVAYIGSGKFDEDQRMIGYLHKAIRPLNHLKSIEDAVVIHRVSRAPERRVFYIGTGTMNSKKALQHVRDVMQMHRNKVVYDAKTGEIQSDRQYQAYTEDFWLPRPEDGKGTEIDTLQGSQGFDATDELDWFQKKLFRALGVPLSRLENEASLVFAGRQDEISREEVKFQKSIAKMRQKFSQLFLDLLRTQLILKQIISLEDWESIYRDIKFDFRKDNPYAEQKELETFNKRFGMMRDIQDYIGTYVSHDWVMRNILRMGDEEIEEQRKLIEKEKQDGFYETEDDSPF